VGINANKGSATASGFVQSRTPPGLRCPKIGTRDVILDEGEQTFPQAIVRISLRTTDRFSTATSCSGVAVQWG